MRKAIVFAAALALAACSTPSEVEQVKGTASVELKIGDPCDPNDPSTYEPYRCVEVEDGSGYAIAN